MLDQIASMRTRTTGILKNKTTNEMVNFFSEFRRQPSRHYFRILGVILTRYKCK